MSRISHLPPRCPPSSSKENELSDLIRYPSLDTIVEEHPSWLDEVISNSNNNNNRNLNIGALRRSASDSATILQSSFLQCHDFGGSENSSRLRNECVYGPNSPRQKSDVSETEANALMESMPVNKLQYLMSDSVKQTGLNGDFGVLTSGFDQDKVARRRSGQRSRVRKLQYIAELERTVEVYQTMGAELASRVASHFQHRVALSVENKNLRNKIAELHKQKMIKSGQYQYLKNESEKLKMMYGCHRRSKSAAASCFDKRTSEMDSSRKANWQTYDFEKLSLN